MFSKTNLISTLVATFWSFFGGFLLWEIIGGSLLANHSITPGLMKSEPDFIYLVIGNLIMAFVFASVYSKWSRGHHSVSEGAEFGLWIGLLLGLGSGLISYATSNNLDLSGTFLNAVLYIIYFIAMGILASLIYRKFSAKHKS